MSTQKDEHPNRTKGAKVVKVDVSIASAGVVDLMKKRCHSDQRKGSTNSKDSFCLTGIS